MAPQGRKAPAPTAPSAPARLSKSSQGMRRLKCVYISASIGTLQVSFLGLCVQATSCDMGCLSYF